MKLFRTTAAAATAVLALAGLSACGSSSNSSSSGDNSRGPITFVSGKDNNNIIQPTLDIWNKAHPKEKVTFKQQSASADDQHDDLVQNFQAKNSGYDVVAVDVVWTAEFAAKGWLTPFTGKNKIDTSAMLAGPVKAVTYNGKMVAAPWLSDGGLLFYRKDLVKTPPTTWDAMMKDCAIAKKAGIGCYGGQFAQYEGLTCNITEAIASAGGELVKSDGKTAAVDSAAGRQGLQNIVTAFKDGNIPADAVGWMEEPSRTAFQSGKLLFMRNWPYVDSLMSATDGSSKVAGKFGVANLPGKSTLGGHNLAISEYSKHKATARDFIKFMESEAIQKNFLVKASNAPVLASLYDDPTLVAKFPYLPYLKTAINTAVPRPVSPYYPAVTKAIQDNSFAAIKGSKTVAQAISDMAKAINSASSSS